MSFAPYEPPAAQGDARPPVIRWFRAYACLMATASLAGLGFAVRGALRAADGPPLVLLVSCLAAAALAALFGFAALVPFKPWGWTVGLVAIALGLGGCTMVLAAPLLVLWLKPVTKAAFARL